MNIDTENSSRLEYIDMLKGMAICMVILVHFTARIQGLNEGIALIGAFGQMGCQLFFVISAFLAMKSLANNNSNFFKKRLTRLLPHYYIAMGLHIVTINILRDFVKIDMNFPRTDMINVIANIFFVQRIGGVGGTNDIVPGVWYIFVLLLFYLIIYIIAANKLIDNDNINKWLLASVLIAILSGAVHYTITGSVITNNDYLYSSIFVQLPVLLCGVKLYFNYIGSRQGSVKGDICVSSITLITAFVLFSSKIQIFLIIIPFICGIGFFKLCNLLIIIKKSDKLTGGEKCTEIIQIMGKYSYEMFFMHIYPASYGVRAVRIVLDKLGFNINGTVLFFVLIIPVYAMSLGMAFVFRKIIILIRHVSAKLFIVWRKD